MLNDLYCKRLRLFTLLLFCCLLLVLSAFKTLELYLSYIYQLERFLGGDKLMHFKLSAVLSFLALLAFLSPQKKLSELVSLIALIFCFLLAGLGLDELHQALTSTRRFEWMDLAYGVGGIVFGMSVFLLYRLLISCLFKFSPDNAK